MTTRNRMALLEDDLASRSATPRERVRRPRRRRTARAMQVDDGTPVAMTIGGRLVPHSGALTAHETQVQSDVGRTVAPLLPTEPPGATTSTSPIASAPAPPATAAPSAPEKASPAAPAASTTPSPSPATSPSPAPGATPADRADSTTGGTPESPGKVEAPRTGEDESFKEDLLGILASHRPDPASPPVPEPAPAPPEAPTAAPEASTPTAQSHAVFDRLGKQMSTATTYDLGPVALERRLDELDRAIAAEVSNAEATRDRAGRVDTLRGHDDLLDVSDVRASLAAPPPAAAPPTRPARRVQHDVPVARTRPGLSCGAAAAASLVGWRDRIDPSSPDLPAGEGAWAPYADGRNARGVADLAVWGLTVTTASTAAAVLDALDAHGPLWLAASPPGEHAVVLSSSTDDGADPRLTVLDPCSAEAAPIEQSWTDLRARVGATEGLPLTVAHLTTS